MGVLPRRTQLTGIGLVVGGVVFQAVWLGLPAAGLSAALLVALAMWLWTDWRISPALPLAYGIGLSVFVAHVAEEYGEQFQVALPALFGRAAWTGTRYLVFNGVWAGVFLTSWLGVRRGEALAALVALFFAIGAGVGNGIGHLLGTLARGGYFPGAWTAPACIGIGLWMTALFYKRDRSAAPPNQRMHRSGCRGRRPPS
jgi:hypothetical protein